LPNYAGVAVHDALSSYGTYAAGSHALCNAHLLRELTAVEESLPGAVWPTRLKALLVQMKDEVTAAKQHGRKRLPPKRLRRGSSAATIQR
jgi:transposase